MDYEGVKGEGNQNPLSMMLADGSIVGCSYGVERVLVVDGDVNQGVSLLNARSLEDEGRPDEDWSSSCLVQFSSFLGMLTKGFKEEILALLKKLLKRKGLKAQEVGSKGKKIGFSRFEREF